jgi:hypothetical protein
MNNFEHSHQPERREHNRFASVVKRLLGNNALKNTIKSSFESQPGVQEAVLELLTSPRLQDSTFRRIDAPNTITTPVAEVGDIIALPVSNFIAAPEFTDWINGRSDGKKNGRVSKKVIAEYAKQPSETAPPISMAIAYRQPNGLVAYELVGDGAHRLAAAKKRGDEYIKVINGVSLVELEQDYIELPERANS